LASSVATLPRSSDASAADFFASARAAAASALAASSSRPAASSAPLLGLGLHARLVEFLADLVELLFQRIDARLGLGGALGHGFQLGREHGRLLLGRHPALHLACQVSAQALDLGGLLRER
jgi:hypothetical protein